MFIYCNKSYRSKILWRKKLSQETTCRFEISGGLIGLSRVRLFSALPLIHTRIHAVLRLCKTPLVGFPQ